MVEPKKDAGAPSRAVADVDPATGPTAASADAGAATLPAGAGPDRVEVPVGPFEREPVELGCVLMTGRDGRTVSGANIVRGTTSWLTEVLAEAGVELGAADRTMVELIAGEGWSVAQVVGGWVSRAHRPHGDPGSRDGPGGV